MDFSPTAWLGRGMDEADIELLRLLYTHIGMEMIEAGDSALRLGGPRKGFDGEEISDLERSIAKITALLQAANVIRE